jgi:proline iminopeptidase
MNTVTHNSPTYITKAYEDDPVWKYKVPEKPNKEDWLKVSDNPKHEIHWSEYGNPHGDPVMFFHGGPGASAPPNDARFFDPKKYRIILFDQRGCGQSKPNAG